MISLKERLDVHTTNGSAPHLLSWLNDDELSIAQQFGGKFQFARGEERRD